MTARRRRLLWGSVAMVLAATTLAVMLRPLRKERGFHVPDAAEARAAEGFFVDALAEAERLGADFAGVAHGAPRFGLEAARLASPAALALSEPDGACGGRGAFLVRLGGEFRPVAITAPHRGADRDTGPLAKALFAEHGFAAAGWNSAPRGTGEGDCPEGGDIARLSTHYLTAFSLAFARRHPGGRIVQLHGFDTERRTGLGAREADAILSDGSATPGDRLLDVADCLSRLFPGRRIAVYPIDSDELGATGNAQGKALRAAGYGGFTHLELSASFRRDLVRDSAQRTSLALCLGANL